METKFKTILNKIDEKISTHQMLTPIQRMVIYRDILKIFEEEAGE